jgi:AhpD family alkylhydroperoxidase
MQARLNPFDIEFVPKFAKHLMAAANATVAAGVPAATMELVRIRASQINGCAGCLDMHTKEALQAGETPLRLSLVAAWRDAIVFTEAERAALELAELGTRLADGGGVGDEAWAGAAKHFDEPQLMAIVCQVALINAFNRMNVMTRQPGGDYQPGHLPI